MLKRLAQGSGCSWPCGVWGDAYNASNFTPRSPLATADGNPYQIGLSFKKKMKRGGRD